VLGAGVGVVLPVPPLPPQAVRKREIERARIMDRLNGTEGTFLKVGWITAIKAPRTTHLRPNYVVCVNGRSLYLDIRAEGGLVLA
jgi:hypothetical protein